MSKIPELPSAFGLTAQNAQTGEIKSAIIGFDASTSDGLNSAGEIAEDMANTLRQDMTFVDKDGKATIFASKDASAARARQFGGYSQNITQNQWDMAFGSKTTDIKQ